MNHGSSLASAQRSTSDSKRSKISHGRSPRQAATVSRRRSFTWHVRPKNSSPKFPSSRPKDFDLRACVRLKGKSPKRTKQGWLISEMLGDRISRRYLCRSFDRCASILTQMAVSGWRLQTFAKQVIDFRDARLRPLWHAPCSYRYDKPLGS